MLFANDLSTSHRFGSKLSSKLQENNYMLWNQQVEGVILTQRLYKVVVNPRIPVKFKTPQNQFEFNIWYFRS